METGLFTGKKFGDYFNKSKEDWINARRIINRLDKAPQIADYGKRFYGSISYTTRALASSPREFLVLDALRQNGVLAEAALLVLLVGFEIAFEPLHMAVALE